MAAAQAQAGAVTKAAGNNTFLATFSSDSLKEGTRGILRPALGVARGIGGTTMVGWAWPSGLGRQAGRHAGRQAGRQREAGRQASRQAQQIAGAGHL